MKRGSRLSQLCATVAVGLLAVVASGCSDGDDARSASPTPEAESATVRVVAQDRAFSLTRIEVPAGAATTITLDNRDATPHTLSVFLRATPEGDLAADTGRVDGGDEGEAVVLFTSPGEHAYRCEVHPTIMRGILVVR